MTKKIMRIIEMLLYYEYNLGDVIYNEGSISIKENTLCFDNDTISGYAFICTDEKSFEYFFSYDMEKLKKLMLLTDTLTN